MLAHESGLRALPTLRTSVLVWRATSGREDRAGPCAGSHAAPQWAGAVPRQTPPLGYVGPNYNAVGRSRLRRGLSMRATRNF